MSGAGTGAGCGGSDISSAGISCSSCRGTSAGCGCICGGSGGQD